MSNEQKPMSQAEKELLMAAADQKFREEMKQNAHPKAQEWVKLDESVQQQEKRVSEYDNEINKRKDMGLSLYETEQQLSDAQNGRDAHLASGRSSIFQLKEREQWDSKQARLNKEVGEYQKNLMDIARRSSPEKIGELQQRMETKQQDLDQVIAQRQGIAKLPSEVVQQSMQDRIEKSQHSWSPSQDEAQRQSGNAQGLMQEQSQSQHQPDGTAAGQKLRPNYILAVENQADRDFVKQLEHDQTTMHQKLGRPATDSEMQDFIKQREMQQSQQQAPQQTPFQQQLQERRQSQSQQS